MLERVRLEKLRQLRTLQREKERRAAVALSKRDVFAELEYVPTERQALFHEATEFDVLYGGAAGGGKTVALVMEGIKACVRYPGIRVGAFRRTYSELEESMLAELSNFGFAKVLGAQWNGTKYNLTFPNGSRIMFRYAETLVDATRRQGGQYQLLLFDERTLTPPEVCSFLESRLRSGREDIPVIGIRSGTNPGGIGHGDVKRRYVDATDNGTKIITDKRNRTVRFIPSKLSDNPHVNPEYAQDLDALPDAMRAAFRDGSWTAFSGQVFEEWNVDLHIVPRFAIPAGWPRYNGIDYGFAAPWAVLWGAQDQDGRVWIYREVTATKVIEREQARRILAAEPADEIVGVRSADPAMWQRSGEALSVADQYAAEGVVVIPADNDRLVGKQRVHSYLANGPACRYHREQGLDECPMLHVLQGTAPELTRTLPNLPYDPRHVEDVDTRGEDHQYDALRYMLMAIGGRTEFYLEPDPDPNVPATLHGMPEHLGVPLAGGRIAVLPDSEGNLPVTPAAGIRGKVVIVE
jgi:hypothetical protein